MCLVLNWIVICLVLKCKSVIFILKRIYFKCTRVRGITFSASARHGKVMGSMLGRCKPRTWCSESAIMLWLSLDGPMLDPNRVIAKDVKSCTYCCGINSTSRGNVLDSNRRNSLPCTVKTSRQRALTKKYINISPFVKLIYYYHPMLCKVKNLRWFLTLNLG